MLIFSDIYIIFPSVCFQWATWHHFIETIDRRIGQVSFRRRFYFMRIGLLVVTLRRL